MSLISWLVNQMSFLQILCSILTLKENVNFELNKLSHNEIWTFLRSLESRDYLIQI
jgi:hypothetical protein